MRLRLGDITTLTLRPGRQVWRFGSQRLIGVREGPNVRRRFDALRLILNVHRWEFNGLVGQPAENTRGIFDDDTNDTQTIWGLYTVWQPLAAPVDVIDFYYLGFRQKWATFDQGTGDETRHTVGVRVAGTKAGWDYNWEGMAQWGTFDEGDIRAWTLATVTGYTWHDVFLHPRLGLSLNIASGDRDPEDPNLQTFNPLFPRGNYFSELALLGPRNFFNIDPSLTVHMASGVIVSAHVNLYWRLSPDDGVYAPSGQLLRAGRDSNSRFVGTAVSLLSEWQVNRHLRLSLSYAHIFPGRFIRETGADEAIDFVETTVKFLF